MNFDNNKKKRQAVTLNNSISNIGDDKEKKRARKLGESKSLLEAVMKKCKKMRIKDVQTDIVSANSVAAQKDEKERWEVIAKTSLIVVLDERMEFVGVGCAQIEMPYTKGFVINCALTSAARNAEEEAFKKIFEKVDDTTDDYSENNNNNNMTTINKRNPPHYNYDNQEY